MGRPAVSNRLRVATLPFGDEGADPGPEERPGGRPDQTASGCPRDSIAVRGIAVVIGIERHKCAEHNGPHRAADESACGCGVATHPDGAHPRQVDDTAPGLRLQGCGAAAERHEAPSGPGSLRGEPDQAVPLQRSSEHRIHRLG